MNTNLHPVFAQALAPFLHSSAPMVRMVLRPHLTRKEDQLLTALQLMKSWVISHAEPCVSGRGDMYASLQRDLAIADKAIQEATSGNEQ